MIAALVGAVVGPRLAVFAAPRARPGGIAVRMTPMSVSVVIEVGGVVNLSLSHQIPTPSYST